jgi:hypothetical protein
MNFKHFGIIVLVVSVAWGCQQNTDKKTDNTEFESTTPQEQEQSSSQPQQDPNQFQPQQQGGEISDEELQQFVSASQHLQVINQQAQQKMVASVEQGGLDVERFNEIQQAQQDPNQEASATDEELKQYETAIQELQKIQVQAQQQMQEKIKEEGLTESRFQEISMVLQNDPELQEKFRAIQQQTN